MAGRWGLSVLICTFAVMIFIFGRAGHLCLLERLLRLGDEFLGRRARINSTHLVLSLHFLRTSLTMAHFKLITFQLFAEINQNNY